MKKARFTETQILRVLKEVEGGRHVKDVCRENGVSEASYYIGLRGRPVVEAIVCGLPIWAQVSFPDAG